jgi:hypothetical protein
MIYHTQHSMDFAAATYLYYSGSAIYDTYDILYFQWVDTFA